MTKRATIQLLVIIIGIAFEVMGTGYGHFSVNRLWHYDESIRGFVYYSMEHLKFIALVLLMWLFPAHAADYKTDGMFVVLAVLDFVDYLVTGNSVWFSMPILSGHNPIFPVSMNTISIAIFTIYAHGQWKMNSGRDLY